ncbi:uncharacterized protein LOC121235537 [Juglans microcarpa x Juglans regia]|uniref:uncharacterized protein LOC121235537 n=1 Tax=Juglans microcarpa x Juglans regia TaxID=2249226 RepID=UPI001B7F141C|nr:uncharacterized protein LOC121235537 [Juglans microcarpa x Juglans regia]
MAFLEGNAIKVGVRSLITGLLMKCVETVNFSVLVNGKAGRNIRPTRGIRAKVKEWRRIYGVLQLYESASGQALNKEKTSIMFSNNTSSDDRRRVNQEAGVVMCDSYERYLGLPAFVGRSKYNAFQSIKERIWLKIQNWKTSFLSKAGKEIMIKAVLQAVPTYTIGVFLLPKRLCTEIEGLLSRFW